MQLPEVCTRFRNYGYTLPEVISVGFFCCPAIADISLLHTGTLLPPQIRIFALTGIVVLVCVAGNFRNIDRRTTGTSGSPANWIY